MEGTNEEIISHIEKYRIESYRGIKTDDLIKLNPEKLNHGLAEFWVNRSEELLVVEDIYLSQKAVKQGVRLPTEQKNIDKLDPTHVEVRVPAGAAQGYLTIDRFL